MNTYFGYLSFTILFFLPALLAIYAFRIFRERSLMAVKTYRLDTDRYGPSRWAYKEAARRTSGLRCRWPFMAIAPQWFLVEEGRPRSLTVVTWKNFNEEDAYWAERWHKDNEYYLLVRRSDWTVQRLLLAAIMPLVALIAVGLWMNFHSGAFSAEPTPEPTQMVVVPTQVEPTSAPRPSETPEPEVEVVDGGDSIVINLDQQAGDALLEWLNEHTKGTSIPTLSGPLVDWLNSLPWPEVAAFEMPEGMDGFVVVARRGDGFELLRLDENGNPVGGPVALKEVKEFTLHARELQWGVRYSDKFRVTNNSQGHIDVYVAEFGEPTMATGYHVYNYRWYHWLIGGVLLLLIGYAIYRRLTY